MSGITLRCCQMEVLFVAICSDKVRAERSVIGADNPQHVLSATELKTPSGIYCAHATANLHNISGSHLQVLL